MPPKLYRKTQGMAMNFLMMRNIWNHSFTSMFFQIYKLSLSPKFSLHQKLTYHNQKLWNWKNVCSFGIFWKSDLRKKLNHWSIFVLCTNVYKRYIDMFVFMRSATLNYNFAISGGKQLSASKATCVKKQQFC